MSVPDLPDPILVTTPDGLRGLVRTLAEAPAVAVDTESNSLYAYQERVCLIQFSIPGADYLLDPLPLEDLSSLGAVFSNPGIEKVFHAAEYDLICLQRDFGFGFDNLFDTMIAAQILGRRKVGLNALLEDHFGVRLNKRYQRANWGQRPLPDHLLAYARLDTHYLIPLRDRLRADLLAEGRWALAEEDFARACRVNARPNHAQPADCWRINGAYDLEPVQAAVLQELCRYRDRMARSLDRPLFKVISDQTLLAIAQTQPRDNQALGRLPGMTSGQMRRHAEGLLAAVRRGQSARPPSPPAHPRPSQAYLARLEALRQWRKSQARKIGVDSNVVLPKDVMEALAAAPPRDRAELADWMGDLPWRYERFGDQILAVLSRSRRR